MVKAVEVTANAYLFESVFYNIASRGDLFLLPDSVYAVKGLVLDHGIPLQIVSIRFAKACISLAPNT